MLLLHQPWHMSLIHVHLSAEELELERQLLEEEEISPALVKILRSTQAAGNLAVAANARLPSLDKWFAFPWAPVWFKL